MRDDRRRAETVIPSCGHRAHNTPCASVKTSTRSPALAGGIVQHGSSLLRSVLSCLCASAPLSETTVCQTMLPSPLPHVAAPKVVASGRLTKPKAAAVTYRLLRPSVNTPETTLHSSDPGGCSFGRCCQRRCQRRCTSIADAAAALLHELLGDVILVFVHVGPAVGQS